MEMDPKGSKDIFHFIWTLSNEMHIKAIRLGDNFCAAYKPFQVYGDFQLLQ